MATIVNPADLSPTFGVNTASCLTTIASSAQTCLAIDNAVSRATTPLIDLYHNAATVANDFAYELDFNAQNSTPAKKTFASVQAQVSVNTASSEMGTYLVNTINAGSSQNNIKVGNNLGQYRGTQTNTTPPAGFIGETISSFVGAGSAVAVSTGVGANVTSISLTPGVWDVSGLLMIKGTLTGTAIDMSLSTTSATAATFGDNRTATPTMPTALSDIGLTISSYRQLLNTTTTIYLVVFVTYTVGTATAYGRISATRVG